MYTEKGADSISWIFYFCCIYIALDKVIWWNKICKRRIMNLQPMDRKNDGLLELKKHSFLIYLVYPVNA